MDIADEQIKLQKTTLTVLEIKQICVDKGYIDGNFNTEDNKITTKKQHTYYIQIEPKIDIVYEASDVEIDDKTALVFTITERPKANLYHEKNQINTNTLIKDVNIKVVNQNGTTDTIEKIEYIEQQFINSEKSSFLFFRIKGVEINI